MDALHSTNKTRTIRLLAAVALVGVALLAGGFSAAQAQQPAPRIEAFAWFDRYSLVDWPAGLPVAVTIENPDYQTTFTPDSSSSRYDFFPGVDLQPGSLITATNGETTRALEISSLSATVEADTGIVTGVATPNRAFHMRTDGDHFTNPIEQDVNAGPDGSWSVDFSALAPMKWFTRGEMWESDDDGDVTYAIWHVHNELVEVWLAQNELRAFDWPLNTELTFSVDDPATPENPDLTTTAPTQPMNWMEGTWAVASLGGYQLRPGMVVTVRDETVETSTVVEDVKITRADFDNDLVYGFAPPHADVELWSGEDNPVLRFFNADENGNWMVDYRIPSVNGMKVDVNPGDNFSLFMREIDKDSTVYNWSVPSPWLTAFPESEYVESVEWSVGLPVHLAIDDPRTAHVPDYQADTTASIPEWETNPERGWASFRLSGYDLKVGDLVVMTGGGFTIEHVVRNLAITSVDVDADTVAGTADPGVHLQVWEHEQPPLDVVAGEDGAWLAYLRIVHDIVPGSAGRAWIIAEGGNATAVEWWVRNPRFTVFPEWEFFDGLDWPDGATVSISVEGKPECSLERESWGSFFNGNFPKGCNVEIGDTVTFDDGTINRTHTIQNLSVNSVDVEADTVAGTADPGVHLQVWVHEQSTPPVDVVAGEDGTWLADLIGTYDIAPGTAGRAWIIAEGGNATAVDWTAPPFPWLIAFPENDVVQGWEWPEGATVHLAIDDPTTELSPDYQADGDAEVTNWGDPRTYFRIDFAGTYDLKPGDVVALSYDGTEATHVVRNLAITSVDMEADTVAGTAGPGVQLQVWAHAQSAPPVDAVAGEDGTWLADFEGMYDIVPGAGGRAWIIAEGGNATAVDWWVPSPWLTAFPEWDFVEGFEWPMGAPVHLTIDDPATEASPDLERDDTAESSPWGDPRTYVSFDLAGAYDLKPGDVVTLSDGVTERTLVVQNVSITAVDAVADTVAGTADPGAVVNVWPHETGEQVAVTTSPSGTWRVDLTGVYDIVPGSGGRAEIRDDLYNGTAVDWSAPWPLLRDEFDGSLREGWYWVNENSDKWNLTDQPGFLRIYASPYPSGGENLLLRSVAQGDFMIKTRVLFEPDTNFQLAGLVIWQDENNFLQLGRAFCDTPDVCVGNGIYFDKILGGNFTDGNFATSVGNPSEVYLRLERRGDMVRAFYSVDQGISWYEIGTHWIPSDFQVNAVGLTAAGDYDTSDSDIPADFDFFELTQGWGFLPEGFHDNDQGDVPSWACNAGGWAVDPDDRATRINVDVVVDHQTVASLEAGEFRQDLLDAGVCEGGNCGFSTSMWGAISAYEPHRVDAWAQDYSTGEWVLLRNSAKTLTCRTYDIYAYDPLTGQTKQITNLPDTHEFNPRWSPDGKKIVHDTWQTDWSSHGVYMTDLKTGVSAPLSGAEGGSYPIWSPSGKWIAFDRGADNDNRLFIVPPTGGAPTLVRDDAVMAGWAPNSQRLAFHRPSDGSIRTVDLKGSSETIVVQRGNGPAWSPDGEWIAFEVDGDVWKVRVNSSGNPLGDPIQLTSSPAWEGRPTWSNNSKTIAFHAGMGQDTDIWTVSAAGGEPTWLTGAPGFGDYDANYSFNGKSISYASFSPEGQGARLWVAAFTNDTPAGAFGEGTHPYHFEFEWSVPEPGSWSGQEGEFVVNYEASSYDGYVLLRGPAELRGVDSPEGLVCEGVDEINPSQLMRFLVGWVPDYGEITYAEARAHFESMSARAVWDDGTSADLVRREIFPFSSQVDWPQYVCTYTVR